MKKTLLSIFFAFILTFSVFLTGCGDKGLKNNPPTNATVISNGGMSVVKGDYLYFVNGYVDETTLTKDDNKMGKITKGAIYRTKLDNQEISKDKDGFLNNADCVVSKIVGFSNGGFEIIDDYIFYATPYMKLSSDGTLQNNRVEIHRIDIDGTDDEIIYVTSQSQDNLDWTIRKVGDTPYLLIYEGEKIKSVNAKNGDVVATIENSTSYAFYHDRDYVYTDARNGYLENNVFYTRAITSSDGRYGFSGNAICSFNIATGDVTTHHVAEKNTYVIKHVTNEALYYTYTSTAEPIACLYKRVITGAFESATEIKLTDVAYDSYYFVDYGNDLIIANTSDATWRLEGGNATKVLSANRTILGVFGEYGYYASDNNLIRFNIRTGEAQDAYGNLKTLLTNKNYLDFDNRRVYVYAEYTAENEEVNNYLTYFNESYTSENFKQRFVGVFECDDVPAVPEQPKPEFEGDTVDEVPHID